MSYRRRVYGLWKDNQASYHFHTPVEYEVLAKNPTHYQKITTPIESANFHVKNEESIHDAFIITVCMLVMTYRTVNI